MKKSTIKEYVAFKFIMNNGVKVFAKYGTVFKMPREKFVEKFPKYSKNTDELYGIMVTKKLGNAVTRNRVKRKIRITIRNTDLGDNAWVIIGRKI